MAKPDLQEIKRRYGVIGKSPELDRALDVAVKVAPIDLSVLIIGESGVGKEIIPRIIHENSPRKHSKKFFAINCGSIPEGTIDSELFGHEKGAFTGAIGEREGYFAAADGGTLFLDEVGELPLATQARLLRVLETGEYIRVGSSQVRKTDVRIVAATNVNMRKAISERRFREDLYYRLNTIPIFMPPLRERGEDVVLLFKKFAADISAKYGMPAVRLTEGAKSLLMQYSWPGNIRQLKNLTEQISVISSEREITREMLLNYITPDDDPGGLVLQGNSSSAKHSYENEREILYRILYELKNEVAELKRVVNGNMTTKSGHGYSSSTPSTLPVADHLFDGQKDDERHHTFMTDTQPAVGDMIISHPRRNAFSGHLPTDISDPEDDYEETPLSLKEIERKKIEDALKRSRGKRKKAAMELGISERTLYRKIKEYNLNMDEE